MDVYVFERETTLSEYQANITSIAAEVASYNWALRNDVGTNLLVTKLAGDKVRLTYTCRVPTIENSSPHTLL
jgi:hypothetical protein